MPLTTSFPCVREVTLASAYSSLDPFAFLKYASYIFEFLLLISMRMIWNHLKTSILKTNPEKPATTSDFTLANASSELVSLQSSPLHWSQEKNWGNKEKNDVNQNQKEVTVFLKAIGSYWKVLSTMTAMIIFVLGKIILRVVSRST